MRRLQNYTPESFANFSSTDRKRKRTREHFSCELCRSRKVACNRKQPCENCIKLKCPDECQYNTGTDGKSAEDASSNQTLPTLGPQLSATNARVAHLERLVERLAGKIGVEPEESSDDAEFASRAVSHPNPYAKAILDHSKAYDAPFYISGHNWGNPCGHDIKYFWENGHVFSAQLTKFSEIAAQFAADRRRTLWDLAFFNQPTTSTQSDMLNLLPERQTCDCMVSRFLKTFNILLPVVNAEHFQTSIDKFWVQKRPETISWLPFYIATVALGFQLPVTPPDSEESDNNGRRRGRAMMRSIMPYASRVAQQSKRPSLASFQTVLLFIMQEKLAQDWVDGNDITNGYLGLLSRMAVTAGLHRDPKNFPNMGDEEAELRRQLFWTFTLVDLEHVMQTGTPCRYLDDNHDVECPNQPTDGWSQYPQHIVDSIPIWAKLLHLTHSRRVSVSAQNIDQLSETLRRMSSYGNHAAYDPSSPSEHNTISAMQRTFYKCLNDRIQALLHWPFLDSSDPASKHAAEARLLEICNSILESIGSVDALIAQTPATVRDAWTHVAIALLRSTLCYTVGLVVLLCRRHAPSASLEEKQTAARVKRLAHEILQVLGRCSHLSFDTAKLFIMLSAQHETIDEKAEAHQNGELSTIRLDLGTAAGGRLVTATKQAIDAHAEQVLAAIERVRTQPNPTPNLLEAPRVLSRADDSCNNPANSNDRQAPLDEAQMLDWLFTFEDWATAPEMFEDVTAPWA